MNKEKCKYCHDEFGEDGMIFAESNKGEETLFIDEEYKELFVSGITIPIKYCPFCGREL